VLELRAVATTPAGGRRASASRAAADRAEPRLGGVSLQRGIDGAEPLRPEPIGRVDGRHEERRARRAAPLATGTLACPRCDAPVTLPGGPASPADGLGCPFCGHAGAVREFLVLGEPTRPTRVRVHVVQRAAR